MGFRGAATLLPTLLLACGDSLGPVDKAPGPWVYLLTTIASHFDTDNFTCSLEAQPILEYPLPPTITTTTQILYVRTATAGNTFEPVRQTRSVRQRLTVELLPNDSVRVMLGPPLADTLHGGITETGIYSGDWTCGTEIPFAADSVLVGLGQDSTRVLQGFFGLQPDPGG